MKLGPQNLLEKYYIHQSVEIEEVRTETANKLGQI